MTIAKATKVLTSKECKFLLEDFRRSYESFQHSFLELGEKAAAIREQEAYGETCESFDQWIRQEGYGHSLVYDSMKAARLYRLMAPTLGPARISLDHESHFRDIPADVTPKEAKAIAGKLIELVPDAAAPKVTRQQVKTAVAAVRPKTGHPPGGSARPDVPASIEAEIADLAPPPAKVTDAETRGGDAERAAQVASAVEEYDGLIPPEDLPDDERQSWQDCLQKLGKEVCGMAEYYRRWPGAGEG